MHARDLIHFTIVAGTIATLSGNAVAVPPPPTLADASITQAVNLLGTQQVSFSANSLSGVLGNTTGQTSANLGSSPGVSSGMSEASANGPALHGGSTFSRLLYQFEYYAPRGGYGEFTAYINAFDDLQASANGASSFATAESFLDISGGGSSKFFNHCVGAATDNGTPCGNKGTVPITPFTMVLKANTVYTVQLQVASHAIANYDRLGPSAASSFAALGIRDISLQGPGYPSGSFYFSQGIAPVPEPESWALLLGGLGLLAHAASRRKVNKR